jgi:hypothetical protein
MSIYLTRAEKMAPWTHVGGLLKAVACTAAGVWAITADDDVVVRVGVMGERPEVGGCVARLLTGQGCMWLFAAPPVAGRTLQPFVAGLSASEVGRTWRV